MSGLDEKEKAKIIRHFLLNSPPGQYSNVENDLRILVGSDLIDRTNPLIAKRYNEEQYLIATVPESDDKFLVTKSGAVGSDEYYLPNLNAVVKYDHVKKSSVSKRDAQSEEKTPEAVESYRSKTFALFNDYVKEFYPDGVSSVYISTVDDGFQINAYISATKVNLSNRWSGRLRAHYTANFKPGNSSVQVDGTVLLKVHYFEEGNVQLNSKQTPKFTVDASSDSAFAKSFVDNVTKAETAYHGTMEGAFSDMSENTFKHLRRKLPLTGQSFNFENWASYNIGSEVTNSH
eukprot:c19992_g1_i1.p1 GENE.c19992_g1_i1~~c19992_g1_i1.p1  ORF type:complete len:289 (+),score=81.71 c19992_g1_i1:28-894(+)